MRSLLIVLAALFALPCYGQDRYPFNTPSSGYKRYGGEQSRWAANPPRIYSASGRYLGELSRNPYSPDSISNPYGIYGSRYSPYSVNNPYGEYGTYSTRLYRTKVYRY